MRKILYVSGTRADYGIMRATLKRIKANPELELFIAATGMHLMPEFGETINTIKEDGFDIIKVISTFYGSASGFLGQFIIEFTNVLKREQPDIVLLLGDRPEALGAACACTYLSIPIFHVHGGDLSSTADEHARHAITKLSHIHLAATEKSAERIRQMGEQDWRIKVVGSPGVASIKEQTLLTKKELEKQFCFDLRKPLLIVLQHPVTGEDSRLQMKETLKAIEKLRLQTIIIHPNADAGGWDMIKEIVKVGWRQHIRIRKSVNYQTFISLMSVASALIGNSSAGIIETPSFKLPTINIGNRERGRERSKNIIDCSHKASAIREAVEKALSKEFKKEMETCDNVYYNENTFELIEEKLTKITLRKNLLQKSFKTREAI